MPIDDIYIPLQQIREYLEKMGLGTCLAHDGYQIFDCLLEIERVIRDAQK